MTQQQADNYYLDVAFRTALNSRARRLQVGALIVKDNMIISDGYNGTPSGFDNNCEDEHVKCDASLEQREFVCDEECGRCDFHTITLTTKPEVLHAEANAITKVAKSTQSCNGATLYCTDMPCMECSKLIVQSGIHRVVYRRPYRFTAGIELLIKAGVIVEQNNPIQ